MLTEAPAKLIGTVAKQSGLPVKTIRYYDEIGLLKTAGRTEGGYRVFAEDVFTRLGFIRRAQSLGLTLSEIKEFLDVHDQGDLPCAHIQAKLEAKLTEIEDTIRQLQLLKQELSGLLSGWQTATTAATDETICPIIES
ncbi:MAG TPA: heavy metal-responsive transcriptional regulator [Nodosilinea sp.]|nr:heavy metal-responsive transcriptional regulator [Nodosilinea sp.]